MIRIITSNWMAAVLGAVVYLASTVAFWKPPVKPAVDPSQAAADSKSSQTGPSWEFTNPEADQLMAELKAEKSAMEKREQQLADLAARLAAERTELNQATQSVYQLQLDFDKNVVRVRESEIPNLKKLAKVYSEMAPESAAKVFAETDDPSVIKIMVFMKDSDTAAIFEAMTKNSPADAKRVAGLSESLRLATYKSATTK